MSGFSTPETTPPSIPTNSATAPAAVLKEALTLIAETGVEHHDQQRVAKIRGDLERVLAEVAFAPRIRCLKALAHRIGKSPETTRRMVLKRFPGSKIGGRWALSDEQVNAIIEAS